MDISSDGTRSRSNSSKSSSKSILIDSGFEESLLNIIDKYYKENNLGVLSCAVSLIQRLIEDSNLSKGKILFIPIHFIPIFPDILSSPHFF